MNLISIIKSKVFGIKNKVTVLSNEIKSLETSVSKLTECPESESQAFQVVEGLTVSDKGTSISYRMEGDTYQYLLEIWKRNITPVLKVQFDNNVFAYLPCSKQVWKQGGSYKDIFVTESFLNKNLYESRIILDFYHNLYFITGHRFLKRAVINESESDCYDDSVSSN